MSSASEQQGTFLVIGCFVPGSLYGPNKLSGLHCKFFYLWDHLTIPESTFKAPLRIQSPEGRVLWSSRAARAKGPKAGSRCGMLEGSKACQSTLCERKFERCYAWQVHRRYDCSGAHRGLSVWVNGAVHLHLWCVLLIILESSETIKCQSPVMTAARGGKARRCEVNKLLFPSKSRDNEGPPLGIAWSGHS